MESGVRGWCEVLRWISLLSFKEMNPYSSWPTDTLCPLGPAWAPLLVSSPHQGKRQWHPTSVLLPGESHGRRNLAGCSPWGREELDMTEWLHFQFLLSCTGEGNGNPLQYSCLENPRDGGAWRTAVYGVAQSRTWLKRLSSSSSSSLHQASRQSLLFLVSWALPACTSWWHSAFWPLYASL